MTKKTKIKKVIKFAQLQHHKHLKMMDKLEDESLVGFRAVIAAVLKDIKKVFKKEKLAKSDDDTKLPEGWSAEVPTIEVDVGELLSKTIEKHLEALRWIMIGDYAGKDAKAAAKDLGLLDVVTPGVLHSSYLHSLDTERKHYEDLFNSDAPEIPAELIRGSMDKINQRAERGLDLAVAQIKHNILESVDQTIQELNNKNVASAHKAAHNALPVSGGEEAVEEAVSELSAILPIRKLNERLKDTVENMERKWKLITGSETVLASAAGAHQAMVEVYGGNNDELNVVWIAFVDEVTCKFCKEASRDASGRFKVYKLSDFKPSGWNYGKKKADWKLCIPGAHINCRCRIVYFGAGFKVDKTGSLVKL